jgi:tetraacyldisaccharide 4'-kinase
LVPAAWLYAAGAGLHRALYRKGPLRRIVLPIRVVSVGNLVVGGSAKTPTAAWIASALRQRGHKVALASRGYGRPRSLRRRTPVHAVSDGRYLRSRVEVAGDEPVILAAQAPGIPVLVGSDRVRVGRRAFTAFGAEVLVLDDGFHHHALHRDVEVVNIDAGFGFGNRHVLPRGPLRESMRALRFADVVAEIDGPLRGEDADLVQRLAPGAIRLRARRNPVALRPLSGEGGESPEVLRGATVGLISALARPAQLRGVVEQLGATVVAERSFRDHHRYRRADLRNLSREAPLWITTEKDALKITPDWLRGADLRVLSIELEVEGGRDFLDWLEERLR